MGWSEVEVVVEVELAVAVPLAAGVGLLEPFSRVTEVEEVGEDEAEAKIEMADALARAMVVPRFSISPLEVLV